MDKHLNVVHTFAIRSLYELINCSKIKFSVVYEEFMEQLSCSQHITISQSNNDCVILFKELSGIE